MVIVPISRRTLLAAAFTAACSKPKATGILGFCFVANHGSRSVTAVDLTRFRTRTHIPLDTAPDEIVAPSKAAKAYVLSRENGTIYEIDALTLAVSRRVRIGQQAVSMRLSRDGNTLWAICPDPAVLVEISLSNLKAARKIRLPAPPDSMAVSRETEDACIISRNSVAIVSLEHAAITQTIASPVEPSIATFRRDGKHLIAGSTAGRSLTIYETATARTVVKLPLGLAPRHFCTTSDGGQLYITGDGMDAVVTVYPYQTEVAETRLAGHMPGTMACTETNLLVANPDDDRITVLDIETGNLAALVQVGKGPGEIIITPDRQYALVLNQESGDLAVIRTFSFANKRYKSAPLFTMVQVGQQPVGAAVVTFS
jgi:DNA-binding beta-propeller fold protein YncE